jgi:protein SCO1/2
LNSNPSRRLEFIVWGALGVTILAIAGAFIYKRFAREPVPLPVIGPVGDFVLTNQFGKAVSAADFRGQVWIANIIFTRCAGPCPAMTKAMKQIQDATDKRVRLVTLTTDPDNDTPEVLKRYSEKFGADFNRWSFLTGSKEQIARLAVQGLKLTAQEKAASERESPADLFIHSAAFVIVDQSNNLRAVFQLEDADLTSKALAATRALMR